LSEKAIEIWQKKLDFLLVEQAKAADPTVKFQLLEEIAAVEERLRRLKATAGDTPPALAPTPAAADANCVFLSYNHADAKTAAALRAALEANGVPVRVDSKDMAPGEQIRAFILKSVGSTGATVCIVSRRSLLSGWVALESLLALAVEELWGQRRFIACYLDDDFLDLGFSVRATDIIDRKIGEIDKLIAKHRAKRIDTAELNEEKSRLFRLRGGLGEVLARLRGGLCLDVRPGKRAASVAKLVETLRPRGSKGQP
jgi:TIR domain-containing protein